MSVIGYILGSLSIRNFCFAYFFLAPFFINQGMRLPLGPIFLASYMFSGSIVLLQIAKALCSFSHRVAMGKLSAVVLSLAFICSLSVAVNTPGNFLDFDKQFFRYLKFLLPALSCLVMVRIWRREDLSRLYTLAFVLGMVSLLLTATQIAFDIPPVLEDRRYSAFFRDSNHFAILINLLLCFTLPIGIRRILEGGGGAGYPLLNFILMAALGLTGSRSGFLIAAVLAAAAILATRSLKLNLALGALILPFLFLFVAVVESRYAGGRAAMSDLGRIWTYLAGFNMVRENPLFGVGFGNVLDVFQQYGHVYALFIGRPLDIHNAFLEIFAESGILAFLLFSLLMGVPFGRLVRRVASDSRRFYPLADLVGLNIIMVYIIHGMVYPEYLGLDGFWVYYSVVILIMRARIQDPDFEFRLFADDGRGTPSQGGSERAPEAGDDVKNPGKM